MYSVRDAIESAKSTVQFAPMLCILFIATRMRALQITQNRGAPQGWVQDGMYMATWAVAIQFLMCLVTPLATGKPAEVDEITGNITGHELAHPIVFYIIQAIRWLCLFLMYGGVITVIIG